MVSKKVVFSLLLMIISTALWGGNSIYKDIYLDSAEDIVRWSEEYNSSGDLILVVSRIKEGKILWIYKNLKSFFYSQNYSVPISAYAVYGDVVTFPITEQKDDSGKIGDLLRTQVALDLKTGTLLWEREIICGVSQKYFYSYSDGENIYIHNLHEYKGSQFLCLKLRTGEIIWESTCLSQPAALVDSGDSLILHSGSLRKFAVYSKEDGSSMSYKTSSAVMLWNGKPLFLRLEAGLCKVIVLSQKENTKELIEETLFTLPAGEVWFYLNTNFNDNDFRKKIESPKVPALLYRGNLILQIKNPDDSFSLVSYSLDQAGKINWQSKLEASLSLRSLYSTNYAIPYKYNTLLLQTYPRLAPFYKAENRWMLFLLREIQYLNGYIIVDLETGTFHSTGLKSIEQSIFIHNIILKSGENYYLFLQRFSESEEGESYILRLNSQTGKFDGYLSFPSDILDSNSDQSNTAPVYYLLQHKSSFLKWKKMDSELREFLKTDPGLTELMF